MYIQANLQPIAFKKFPSTQSEQINNLDQTISKIKNN